MKPLNRMTKAQLIDLITSLELKIKDLKKVRRREDGEWSRQIAENDTERKLIQEQIKQKNEELAQAHQELIKTHKEQEQKIQQSH